MESQKQRFSFLLRIKRPHSAATVQRTLFSSITGSVAGSDSTYDLRKLQSGNVMQCRNNHPSHTKVLARQSATSQPIASCRAKKNPGGTGKVGSNTRAQKTYTRIQLILRWSPVAELFIIATIMFQALQRMMSLAGAGFAFVRSASRNTSPLV